MGHLILETLEERTLWAADPVATVEDLPTEAMVNEPVTFNVSFDNASATSGGPTDVGFGPYLDVVMGEGFDFGSASFLGIDVAPKASLTFSGGSWSGLHPLTMLAVPTAGATEGDVMHVFELPFGSFVPDQPKANLAITGTLDHVPPAPIVGIGSPISVTATGGFQYGTSATGTPGAGTSLIGATDTASLTPAVLELNKTYIGPELETATGPNYMRMYEIGVDIANLEAMDTITITDPIPDDITYAVGSVEVWTGPGRTGTDITSTFSISEPAADTTDPDLIAAFGGSFSEPGSGGVLTLTRAASITGAVGVDFYVTYDFFVSDHDATSDHTAPNQIIADGVSGNDDKDFSNSASITASFDADHDGTGETAVADLASSPSETNNTVVFEGEGLTIQKSVARTAEGLPASTSTVLSPGDTLTYTIAIQVSDYWEFDTDATMVITDVLGDGQTFDTGSATLSFTEAGVSTGSLAIAPASEAKAVDGTTTLAFDIGSVLAGSAVGADGLLTGDYHTDGDYLDGATTGTLTFTATVDEEYISSKGSGDLSIDLKDTLTNSVTIVATDSGTGEVEGDESGTSVQLPGITISKTYIAVDDFGTGAPAAPSVVPRQEIQPTDVLTYSLKVELPIQDYEDLKLVDYLPLPIFSAPELGASGTVSAVGVGGTVTVGGELIPTAGTIKLGSDDTFSAIAGLPSFTTSAAENSITIDYGAFDTDDGVDRGSATIHLLFSVTASDAAFTDGLFLTNQWHAEHDNSFTETFTHDAIIQIERVEPRLNIKKGHVSTTSTQPGVSFSSTVAPAGVTFADPGDGGGGASTASPSFTGTISTRGAFLDADITGIDAGDLVKFVTSIENTGDSDAGAFDVVINDDIPPGFSIPPVGVGLPGLNLRVTDGTGAGIPFTLVGGGTFDQLDPADAAAFFASGIELTDPSATEGSIKQAGSGGSNVVIISYDLISDGPPDGASSVAPYSTHTSTATLVSYSGSEGGSDYVAGLPREHATTTVTDAATETVKGITITKALTSSSETFTSGSDLAVGEVATYTLTVGLPEGTSTSLDVTDAIPAGMKFLELISVSSDATVLDAGGSTLDSGDATVSIASPPGASGEDVIFSFGEIDVSEDQDLAGELAPHTLTIVYKTIVADVPGNTAGATLGNTAFADVPGGPFTGTTGTGGDASATASATVVLPSLTLVKDISPPISDIDDPVVVTLTLSNATGATVTNAWDMTVTDVLPAGFDASSVTSISTPAGWTLVSDAASGGSGPVAGSVIFSSDPGTTLAPGASVSFSFTVDISTSGGLAPGEIITNTATVSGDTIPGDGSDPTHGLPSGPQDTEQRTVTAMGSDTVEISAVVPRKTIIATDQPSTAFPVAPGVVDVAIGEIVTYAVEVDIPEADLLGFTVVDTMDPGLAFVGLNTVTFASGYSIPVELTSTATGGVITPPTPTATPAPGPAGGSTVTFAFGDVFNTTDPQNGLTETIVIHYDALVINSLTNDRTDDLGNSVVASWDADGTAGGATTSTAAASARDVNIVEPELTVDVAFTTPPPVGGFDAGDTVSYTYTIDHATASDATAFDIQLNSVLPPELDPTTIVITPLTGIAASDAIAHSAGVVTGGWETLATTDTDITFTVSGTLLTSLNPDELIRNDATIKWQSLPSAAAADFDQQDSLSAFNTLDAERTGNDGSTPFLTAAGEVGGAANDYNASDRLDVQSRTVGVTKVITGTDQLATADPAAGAARDVAVGEVVTYTVTITVPEGTTPSWTVTDTLDSGLAFKEVTSITASSADVTTSAGTFGALPLADGGGVVTITPDPATAAGAGGVLAVDLGTIVNANTVNATAETITISYEVYVLNQASNVGGGGVSLNNSAAMTWTADATTKTVTASAADVTVVEPLLNVTMTGADDTGGDLTGDGGDQVTVTVQIDHLPASDGPAFDLTFSAVLPADFTFDPTFGTGGFFQPGTTGLVASSLTFTPDGSGATGGTISGTWLPSDALGGGYTAAAAPIEFQYRATVDHTVTPNQSISHTGNISWESIDGDTFTSAHNALGHERTGDTSDPGGAENDFRDSDGITYTIDAPVARGSFVSTSETATSDTAGAEPDVAIGERVRYRIEVDLIEGTHDLTQLTADLPAGFTFVPGSADVSFVATTDVTESADLAGADADADPPVFDVPAARISQLGSVVTFDLGTIVNNDSDEGAAAADLEQIILEFDLVVANDAANQAEAGGTKDVDLGATISGDVLTDTTVSVDVVEPVLTIDKTVNDPNPRRSPLADLTETATGGATGVGSSTLDDTSIGYTTTDIDYIGATLTIDSGSGAGQSGTITAATPSGGGFIFTVDTSTTGDWTVAPDATSGYTISNAKHEVIYTLTVDVAASSDGPAHDAVVTDLVPTGLTFEGFETTPPGWTATSAAVAGGTLLTWTRDDTFDPGGGPIGPKNPGDPSEVFSYKTTVNSAVASGTVIDNDAAVRWTSLAGAPPHPSPQVERDGSESPAHNDYVDRDPEPITVDGPDMSITIDDTVTTTTEGTTLTYDVVVDNIGNEDATGVVATITLPTALDSGSITIAPLAGWTFVVTPQADGTTIITATHSGAIPAGDPAETISVTVNVLDPAPDGVSEFTATATVRDDGTRGPDPTPANNADDDTDLLPRPDLVTTTTNNLGLLNPGQLVTYTVTTTNIGTADSTGVNTTVTLPAGLTVVPGSVPPGTVIAGQTLIIPAAGLLASGGGTETYTFQVVVGPGLGKTYQVNTTAADDGTNGSELFRSNNPSFDRDPTPPIPSRPSGPPFIYAGSLFRPLFGPSVFSFSGSTAFSFFDDSDDRFVRGHDGPYVAPYTASPMFSGQVEPGSTLLITVIGKSGSTIGFRTSTGDAGGNWMVTIGLPHFTEAHSIQIDVVRPPAFEYNDGIFNLRVYFASSLTAPGDFEMVSGPLEAIARGELQPWKVLLKSMLQTSSAEYYVGSFNAPGANPMRNK